MTFENFYPGNSYKLEFAVAKKIAEQPDGEYSPLIFCGPCGVGKTHLLSAIALKAKNLHKDCKIISVSAEQFIDELITSICKNNYSNKEYNKADMLLIDNFEFVAGKESTQDEVFRIFDNYLLNKKQIVLSINDSIGDYTFAPRIKSRLYSGVILNMRLPDNKTKKGIVKGISDQLSLNLDDDIGKYIVDKTNNTTEIKGLLKNIKMIFDISNDYPTIDELKTFFLLSQ